MCQGRKAKLLPLILQSSLHAPEPPRTVGKENVPKGMPARGLAALEFPGVLVKTTASQAPAQTCGIRLCRQGWEPAAGEPGFLEGF